MVVALHLPRRRPPLCSVAATLHGRELMGRHDVGLRTIPVACIVGSLGRARDFDRQFRPRLEVGQQRLAALRRAFRNQEFPPIDVYDIDGAYYVTDGHHRLALAHERGMLDIDAEVIRIDTRPALRAA
jgi:hypothetical protein